MKSTTYSLLIHAALFAMIAWNGFHLPGGGEGQQDGKQTPPPITAEIIDKVPDEAEEEVAIQDDEGVTPAKPTHLGDDCDDFFGGIGITQSGQRDLYGNQVEMIVTEVHHGYPAEKAGIQVGDSLTSSEEIRGEIGTPITVYASRNGQTLTFNMIRDKICTTPPKEKP